MGVIVRCFQLSSLFDLIRQKLEHTERSPAQAPDSEFHRWECDRRVGKLEDAGHLPEAPTAKPALND
jgi:hypothetical protein